MEAFLLTWNPQKWQWKDLPQTVARLRDGIPVERRWSCGNRKHIPLGSRVFLLRQGVEPKGIIASGWVTREPFEAPHWDAAAAAAGKTSYFIMFTADAALDPKVEQPLDLRPFKTGPLSKVQIDAPASGNSILGHVAVALSEAWDKRLGTIGPQLGTGDPELGAMEGQKRTRLVAHRGRERALRDAKLKQTRSSNPRGIIICEVPGCGFNFEAVYGKVGEGFAHVHHLQPLHEASAPVVTRLADLAVVCANCHAMIHRGGECRPICSLIVGK
jgi:hypothetical protein